MRRVIVLGSTGSIGTQALEVIRANPRRFDVVGLSAHSSRDALSAQAEAFGVEHTALGAEEAAQLVHDVEADVVLNGI
ncbi:MAG TPA: 1-deoxy-D-xylulose-5-phosphate reductoisomerase, partial [Microbacterium sp.]|nr:1-deoxy-D-xylulose-5-phosphate reductoisomerase [Microbacterium sp.]